MSLSMTPTEGTYCGIIMLKLCRYMGKYQISFQFWGEGNNSLLIEKDGIEIFSTNSHRTPAKAMSEALLYLNRINKVSGDVWENELS